MNDSSDRKMVATTLRAHDGTPGFTHLAADSVPWHIYQGKQSLLLSEHSRASCYAAPINSVIIGVAFLGDLTDMRPSEILEQFDRFAAGEDSKLKKFLYYERIASGGTVFFWQEVEKLDKNFLDRLRNVLFPGRRYPINWSPDLFKQTLAYNIDPSIPLQENLELREVHFRRLFIRVNLLITAMLFVASVSFARILLGSGDAHDVIVLWISTSAPVVGNMVGKYAGIYQLCKLGDKSQELYLETVLEASHLKVWLTILRLLKWNPIVCLLMLAGVHLWSLISGR